MLEHQKDHEECPRRSPRLPIRSVEFSTLDTKGSYDILQENGERRNGQTGRGHMRIANLME